VSVQTGRCETEDGRDLVESELALAASVRSGDQVGRVYVRGGFVAEILSKNAAR
jgi:hypothetical protein